MLYECAIDSQHKCIYHFNCLSMIQIYVVKVVIVINMLFFCMYGFHVSQNVAFLFSQVGALLVVRHIG
jgi:hypothetical protein